MLVAGREQADRVADRVDGPQHLAEHALRGAGQRGGDVGVQQLIGNLAKDRVGDVVARLGAGGRGHAGFGFPDRGRCGRAGGRRARPQPAGRAAVRLEELERAVGEVGDEEAADRAGDVVGRAGLGRGVDVLEDQLGGGGQARRQRDRRGAGRGRGKVGVAGDCTSDVGQRDVRDLAEAVDHPGPAQLQTAGWQHRRHRGRARCGGGRDGGGAAGVVDHGVGVLAAQPGDEIGQRAADHVGLGELHRWRVAGVAGVRGRGPVVAGCAGRAGRSCGGEAVQGALGGAGERHRGRVGDD